MSCSPLRAGMARRPFGSCDRQSRCRALTVIVPDQAKSAGTLFVLGADHIYMGPTSDLGPVDPQFLLADGSLGAARAIIAAVEGAETRIQANPHTYPLHAALLTDVSALMVQQARDALARTTDQMAEALSCVRTRVPKEVQQIAKKLHGPLIDDTQSHGTTISAKAARSSACQFGKQPTTNRSGETSGDCG